MDLSRDFLRRIAYIYECSLPTRHLRVLRAISKKPIPLPYWQLAWLLTRIFAWYSNPLTPPYPTLRSTGSSLQNPQLREILDEQILGTWALDSDTIDFLWRKLGEDRPNVILEFGAGVSTIVFAKYSYCYEADLNQAPNVICLEQDMDIKEDVESKLSKFGLQDRVRVLYAPISPEGKYRIGAEELRRNLKWESIDWLLIDGPAGPRGCRKWTLPLISEFIRDGARWYLDDGLRDGEIRLLREWSRTTAILVEGIYPVGKGLATGLIIDPLALAKARKVL